MFMAKTRSRDSEEIRSVRRIEMKRDKIFLLQLEFFFRRYDFFCFYPASLPFFSSPPNTIRLHNEEWGLVKLSLSNFSGISTA